MKEFELVAVARIRSRGVDYLDAIHRFSTVVDGEGHITGIRDDVKIDYIVSSQEKWSERPAKIL